ncbi:tRNA-uridine aminocarboxypropyltransferase [Bdellovibrionota bacterium FG-2]
MTTTHEVPLPNRLQVLILQHPQEPDKEIGTAKLAQEHLAKATLRIGLSWPNLSKAVGATSIAKEWAIVYLGSGAQLPEGKVFTAPLMFCGKKGEPLPYGKKPKVSDLKGVIILDGTWSQAKTLWWRNAWLLKCHRIILNPTAPSLYGKLRKEPRRECLSTIESIAEVLQALGEPKEVSVSLKGIFSEFLKEFPEKFKSSKR